MNPSTSIHFVYSAWWLLPIVAVAAVAVWFMYQGAHPFSRWQKLLLGGLRFLSIFIVGNGLLKPYFAYDKQLIQQPTLAIMQDVSVSMQGHDSLAATQQMAAIKQALRQGLDPSFRLSWIPFHARVLPPQDTLPLDGQSTNIGQALEHSLQTYAMQNLQAVLLLSDGQHNSGIHATGVAASYSTPILPIAFGDTAQRVALQIQDLFYNEHCQEGSRFPIEVAAQAQGLAGQQIEIRLTDSHKQLCAHKKINITQDKMAVGTTFMIDAKNTGLQQYTVELRAIGHAQVGQQQNFYVEVAARSQRILLIGHHPHPDMGAIASALRQQEGRQVEVLTLSEIPQQLGAYDLIILHGLPASDGRSRGLLQEVERSHAALWIITTPTSYFPALNKLQESWHFPTYIKTFSAVRGQINTAFSLFHAPKELWPQQLPALWHPQADIQQRKHSYTLLQHGHRALISFAYQGGKKLSLWQAHGWWRWRLAYYRQHQHYQGFNSLINKTATFLLNGQNSELFQLQHRLLYEASAPIVWEARLQNPALEAVSDASVEIHLKDATNKRYKFALSPEGAGRYSLNLSQLKAGTYSYKAQALLQDTSLTIAGHFAIQNNPKEHSDGQCNLPLLQSLATQSDGALFFPEQIEALIDQLNNKMTPQAIYQYVEQITQWIDLYWLLIAALALLCAEWLLRRYWGSY